MGNGAQVRSAPAGRSVGHILIVLGDVGFLPLLHGQENKRFDWSEWSIRVLGPGRRLEEKMPKGLKHRLKGFQARERVVRLGW